MPDGTTRRVDFKGNLTLMLAVTIGLAAACGGGPGAELSPTVPSQSGIAITITGSGANPRQAQIAVRTRVTFINRDAVPHEMASGPHPGHSECPELNVGVLQPGQSRESLSLMTPGTCSFHDHSQGSDTSLQGIVVVR